MEALCYTKCAANAWASEQVFSSTEGWRLDDSQNAFQHSCDPECRRSVDRKHMDGWMAPIFPSSQKYNAVLQILQNCRRRECVPDVFCWFGSSHCASRRCQVWWVGTGFKSRLHEPSDFAVMTTFQEIAAVFQCSQLTAKQSCYTSTLIQYSGLQLFSAAKYHGKHGDQIQKFVIAGKKLHI